MCYQTDREDFFIALHLFTAESADYLTSQLLFSILSLLLCCATYYDLISLIEWHSKRGPRTGDGIRTPLLYKEPT